MKSTTLIIITCLMLVASCKNDNNMMAPRPNVPDQTTSVIKLRATVTMLVGAVYYQNCDAIINVKGFDANGVQNYSEDISFTGPYDTISISGKSSTYSMDLTIWEQRHANYDHISLATLLSDRVDGATPTTYGFGGKVEAKKLKMTQELFLGPGDVIATGTQDEYQYLPNGMLNIITHSGYSPSTQSFTVTGTDEFTYAGTALQKIDRFYGDAHSLIDEFTYYDNVGFYRPGRIVESAGGYTVQADFSFPQQPDDETMQVAYVVTANNVVTNLNYSAKINWKTIIADRELKSNELCNDGMYTSDKNINPFHHLGYLDFYATNFSANNTIQESVNYYNCGFPVLQPLHHEYTYEGGFPVTKITTYKPFAPDTVLRRSKTYYYYY